MNKPSLKTKVTGEDLMFNLSQDLTFSKIFLIFFLLVSLVSGLVLYKISMLGTDSLNRSYNGVHRIDISVQTKAQLTEIVLTSKIIKLIMITEIDTKNNQRFTRWLFANDALSKKIRENDKLMLPLPMFNTDNQNTQQMIGVLNNEFVCTPFSQTVHYSRISALSPPLTTICQLAVPLPRFGLFAGIITIGLTSNLTKDQQDAMKLEVSRIAAKLFIRGDIAATYPLEKP